MCFYCSIFVDFFLKIIASEAIKLIFFCFITLRRKNKKIRRIFAAKNRCIHRNWNKFFSAAPARINLVRRLRNSVFVEENNVIRRLENRQALQNPIARANRRRSVSAPPAVFPLTPAYVGEAERLPRARMSIEKLTENRVAQINDKIQRDELIAKIDLQSLNRKCFSISNDLFVEVS